MSPEISAEAQFKGYTIDLWTREFKQVAIDSGITECVPFNSEKGAALLRAMGAWIDDLWEAVDSD